MTLSKRAENLLKRINKGRFYKAYDPKTPKAMQELVDAGLVTMMGRVVSIYLCYVPSKGYTPFVQEKLPDGWEYMTKSVPRKGGVDHDWFESELAEGWEIDPTRGRTPDGWDRFDNHEELYFRRKLA